MSAGGDAALAVAYSQVGATENPPYSNLASPYTDAWGPGAWCAMFASWCSAHAGYPLPALNGPAGFSYCPSGQQHAYENGEAVAEPEPGDIPIYSWEAWYLDGIAYCSYGVYAGSPAGDHTGHFAYWINYGGAFAAVEGNTSGSSWDNGGEVWERTDRDASQVCCWWRPASFGSGGGAVAPPTPVTPPAGGPAPPWPGVYLSDYTAGGGTAQWQAQMVARGWHLDVDDEYGPASANVCAQFQAEKGLEVDGVVGPITWDAAWTAPIT